METHECNFCNKKFSNKFTLKNHQLNAKYCLEIRKQDNNNFTCMYCKKNLSSKWSLDNHDDFCVDKYKILLQKKDDKINEQQNYINQIEKQNTELLNQIKDLARFAIEKPNYVTNNELSDNRTINNSNSNNKMIDNRVLNMVPMNLTQDSIHQALENKFTENHLMKGQKGLAEFCIEHILITPERKMLMKCTDPSRKTFVYIDEEGKIQKDINADRFTKMISEPVNNVTRKIFKDLQDRYFETLNNANNNDEDTNDEERLSYATDKVVEITSLKSNNNEFIKNLIPPLTTN